MERNRIVLTESDLHRIVKESVKRFLREEHMTSENLETWYRGYNSKYGFQRNHLLWLTDDIGYAREYGNRVEEVIIDSGKLKAASLDDIDEVIGYEFDYYDELTTEEVKELSLKGYNCYGFEAGNSYCLCLWDNSPIVSRRELSREEFDKIEFIDDCDDYKKYDDEY